MFEVDPIDLLAREVLRERTGALVAEACAWSVGLSDRMHHVRRNGRVVATGLTLGMRAAADQQLGADEDARIELADARPGTFRDALDALMPDGRVYADLFDEQVLTPFVLETCVQAVERARTAAPEALEELVDDLGEDDPQEIVRAAEWEAPLKTAAEELVLAALADAPLVEVENEGLPLSLVRAAEAETRAAAPVPAVEATPPDVAGAVFLAEAALAEAELPVPVPPERGPALLEALLAEGIEPDEVLAVLPHLPVLQDTVEEVAAAIERMLS